MLITAKWFIVFIYQINILQFPDYKQQPQKPHY